jgi:hypothetical protein
MCAAGFIFQFLMSCIRCGPVPTLEMVHTDLSLNARAYVDYQVNEIDDSVRKENFLLVAFFDHQEKQLANTTASLNFGFSTAKAWECPDPNFNYSDKVKEINILMINQADTSQIKDVTDYFGGKSEDETYTINDQIGNEYEYGGLFSVYLFLLEYDSIYHTASFRVTATLGSGETFTQQTEEIIFMD